MKDYEFGHLVVVAVITGILGLVVGVVIHIWAGGSYDVEADWYDKDQKVITHSNQLHQLVPVQVVVKSVEFKKEETK